MGMLNKSISPLRVFRKRVLAMTQAEFARWLAGQRGWPVTQAEVSRWELGRISRASMASIETATGGRVTARQLRSYMDRVERERLAEVSP